ncbi:MAG: RluA family pseudouridine synthase [Lachnospiraceae bacterium]|jgi:23S rRNA pseudouridine955/2504/2580 synthase|nr:RluA family pseudouridine synthase [Lachnospiraceae bacterium]
MIEIKINANEAGQRLDKMLFKYLKEAPKSFVYKMLRKKNITLNGKKSSGDEKLSEGDLVKLFLSDETIIKFRGGDSKVLPEDIFVPDIVYEDKNVLFINKPAGMLSQKASADDFSANEYLLKYCMDKGYYSDEDLRSFTPSVCNRLDRNTSGLLTFGKSLEGLQALSACFKDRSVGKFYQAIVKGRVDNAGEIKGYLTKDQVTNKVTISDKESKGSSFIYTEYEPLSSNDDFSLLEIELHTGKTHQIRAHMSFLGHPVIGDVKYGGPGRKHLMLHSHRLVFPAGLEGALSNLAGKEFVAPVPDYFENYINRR